MQSQMRAAYFAGVLASLLAPSNAFVRMTCGSRLVDQRIDPIMDPGKPASHVHAVNGGNGFNFTQPDYLVKHSTCSSCPIKEDLSVYWTPKLYFHNTTDATFTAVPQAGDGASGLGGQVVYYLQRAGPNNDKLRAFPEGFRMVAGDTNKRNFTGDFAAKAVSFSCIDYNNPSTETNMLPNKKCPQGVRAQVFFPACWDGHNVDSDDHASHMSYPDPTEPGDYNSGACPSSHPIHMISLFYEVYYQTDLFDNGWYQGDQQPFVFANGDATGYGFHGDFLNGWNVPTLQTLTDTCTSSSGLPADCNAITFFTEEQMQRCKVGPQIEEDVLGPFKQLPGCNPVSIGPSPADPGRDCARAGTIGRFAIQNADLTESKRFKYLGCAPDSVANRTFGSPLSSDDSQTLERCVDYCLARGFTIAGTEYGSQCFCGNSIPADRRPIVGIVGNCNMPCAGNAAQKCGGAGALSMYQKCAEADSCVNASYSPVT